jgi:formate dehydrogenase iron-sulfur subunit
MSFSRRAFLLWTMGTAAAATAKAAGQEAGSRSKASPAETGVAEAEQVGVLADTTLCIGCRKCEEACNVRNNLPRPAEPFTDKTVFRTARRPSERAHTVVNEYPGSPSLDQVDRDETYAKVQCMHCLTPSCVSACIVGAMTRAKDGAVVYDPDICLGCRYRMVACPFQIPSYEFHDPLKPRVRKCELCAGTTSVPGANPACAAACPTEALVFGNRASLLALAKDRLRKRPDRYLDHIYGENEVGGTSWLYLTGRPGPEVGLIDLPAESPAHRTEKIQHGIFRFGIIPVAFYGTLGAIMRRTNRRFERTEAEKEQAASEQGTDEGRRS